VPSGSSITVTYSAATTASVVAYWIPNATGVDTGSLATNTGTSTSPSVTTGTTAQASELLWTAIANNASAALSANPAAPWTQVAHSTDSTLQLASFLRQEAGKTTYTASGTYGSSVFWGALAFGIKLPVTGGAGGAAAGPGGAGYDARSSTGAEGYTGGGKGGQGALSAGNGGSAALPGGGGGGAASASTAAGIGGNGGNGLIRLTWQPPLQTFNTLVVHRPGQGAPAALSPCQPVPITDTPTNKEYQIQSLLPVNATFKGTYTVLLVANAWNSATAGVPRNLTVTVSQYEYVNGPAYTVQATRTVTPATDVVNGLVTMGEVTLPVKDIPPGNQQVYFTFSVNDTDTGDRFQDVLFLDTTGQTAIVNVPPGSPASGQYVNYYIDEPTADRDLGLVAGTFQDKGYSISVLDYALLSGGPLYVDPGDNLLMTYSPSGAPNLGVTYSPRWYVVRTV
jgi:hypothetical protein